MVKLSAIGDVVHTLPSLAALRALYPGAHITWVVERSSADIIDGHPNLDRILISDRKQWMDNLKRHRRVRETISEIRRFIQTLRDRRYDLVIDFHGLFKSAIVTSLCGADRKIGYRSMQELSGLFYSEKIYEDMEKHAVDRYLDFVRYLGSAVDRPQFDINLEDEHRQRVDELLRSRGIDSNESFVAINPVAFWETKLWEAGKFALLCDRIVSELNRKVVFTGGRDLDVITNITSHMAFSAVDLEGRTTLRDLAYLYTRAELLVTTDSGPMHIAAAVGTPTVALFGPTDPCRTGPYGDGHVILRAGRPCSPCFLKECATKRCMREITVEDVFAAVKSKLR